jgi:hypothetical protein
MQDNRSVTGALIAASPVRQSSALVGRAFSQVRKPP